MRRERGRIMPKGYRRLPIADLCHFVSGNGFRPSDWKTAGLPIIRIQNLNGVESFHYYDGPTKDDWIVETGDLLYAWAGVKGVSFGPTIWSGSRGVLNQHIYKVVPNANIDRYWLFLALKFVTSKIESNAHGFKSSLVHVHKEDITGQHVDVPALEVQETIASILITWDKAIELHDALAEQLQKQHAALIHQLVFGGFRLAPCASKKKAKKYRWFNLPSDWCCERIGSLAREVSERNHEDEGAEILSCSKYDGFVRSLEYFKKQVFSSDLTGYKRIHRGDFGFPSNHVEEGSIGLQNLTDIGLVSPIYIVFRFSANKVDNEYAHYVLKTGLYRHIFEISTSASVDRRGSLRWDEFATIPFPVPSLEEQREVVKILHMSAKRLSVIREERSLLERQKRGLIQKLLTGEWRVN